MQINQNNQGIADHHQSKQTGQHFNAQCVD